MAFRFSGHESFPCRYTWLPKAYLALQDNPLLFADDNIAMVRLGVGKNMVKSIRFWVQVFGVATAGTEPSSLEPTHFGHLIFGENGLDPYLEDARTLWLLHWKVASITKDPLFAWHFLINLWAEPTFSKTEIIRGFTWESERVERPLSDFTKEQHFDIFLHTYVPVRPRKGGEVVEDTLDCPLTELQFIMPAGERITTELNRMETIYAFQHNRKYEITGGIFAYCLFEYWQTMHPTENMLTFRDISVMPGSVGQVFKLSEPDLRTRLESLELDSGNLFTYQASATVPRVIRQGGLNEQVKMALLRHAYGRTMQIQNID